MDASLPRDNTVMAEAETDCHGVDKDEYFYDDGNVDETVTSRVSEQQLPPDPTEDTGDNERDSGGGSSPMLASPVNRRRHPTRSITDSSFQAVVVTHDDATAGQRRSERSRPTESATSLSGSRRRRLFDDTVTSVTPPLLPPSQRQRVDERQQANNSSSSYSFSGNEITQSQTQLYTNSNSSSYSYSGNEITQSQTLLYTTPPRAAAAAAAAAAPSPTFRDISLGHVLQPQTIRARLVAKDILRFRTGAVLSLHFVDANREVFNAVCYNAALIEDLFQAAQPGKIYNVQCQDKTNCLDAVYRLLESIGTVTLYKRLDMAAVIDNNDQSIDHNPHPLLLDVQQRDPLRRQFSSVVHTHLGELGDVSVNDTKTIHLLAVVKDVGTVTRGKRKDKGKDKGKGKDTHYTRCELCLVDASGECTLKVWGNLAETAAADYAHQPIMAFGSVKVGKFNGRTTCTASEKRIPFNSISVAEQRRYPQVEALREWWNGLAGDEPQWQTTLSMAWDEHHKWGQLAQSNPMDFDHFGTMSSQYRKVCDALSPLEEPHLTAPTIQLNHGQKFACDMILNLVQSSGADRLGILVGRSGTGKSAVIAAAEHRLQTLLLRSGGASSTCTVLKLSTTGVAASAIGGSTLHSALNIPFAKRSFASLSVDRLKKLKDELDNVQFIVIDQYSMLKQQELVYIESRLREIGDPKRHFGGFAVLLAGDPAQLAPVDALWVWEEPEPGASRPEKSSKEVYGMFQKVVELTKVMRLESSSEHGANFLQVLDNLRNGTMTNDDHKFLFQKCSREGLGPTTFAERFPPNDPSITYLYLNNTLVEKRNMRHLQLQANGMPITLLQAVGPKGESRDKSNDTFFGLEYEVYLAVGAKVAMVLNVCPRYGLVNGACGEVMDIVYAPGVAPPQLQLYVWVDFGSSYTGPSFFCRNDPTWRRGWVPVHAETRNGRTAIPLRLAFAWTVWKAQGQTFHGKVVADLDAEERAHGLIYTALSRVTKLDNLGIPNGVPREQCDGIPDKMACRKKEESRLRRLATVTMERLEQRQRV